MTTKAHYDDPTYNYQKYWFNRDYEHQSEILAICQMLNGKYLYRLADVGGGFGRLYPTFSQFAKNIYLLEPSLKLRQTAHRLYPNLHIKNCVSHHLPFPKNTFDLISLIRVAHHLPDLNPTFQEIYRALKPSGYFLLEFANSTNFKAYFSNLFLPIPQIPIEKRSFSNIQKKTIPFVNHHPQTILRLLYQNGFIIEKILSVSNFRFPFLKQILPLKILLFLESVSQQLLAHVYFGPSIFVLAKKAH